MSVPRSSSSAKEWFPPATFQLRLRSLQSIVFIASSKPRNGHNSGYFYITLHEKLNSDAFWRSQLQKWTTEREETRLVWNDLDFEHCNVHPALRSVIIVVRFQTAADDEESTVITRWGIYFSGLRMLGIHAPPHGRLPPETLLLFISGSCFSSDKHIRDNTTDTFVPRFVHIGKPEDCQSVGSYDTTLLGRLQFIQRALKKQEDDNRQHKSDLRQRGIVDLKEAKNIPQRKDVRKSVSVFSRQVKSASTRLRESQLHSEIERARVRVQLLVSERHRLQQKNCDMVNRKRSIVAQVEEKSSFLMRCFHGLAKEKANFRSWMEEFEQDCKAHSAWTSALWKQRLALIHGMTFIYPVGNLDHTQATLRWVALPSASELRDMAKNEVIISVVIGWLADLLTVISRILDAPLRYPVHLMGSTSYITDHLKNVPPPSEVESREFPLFVGKGNSDWSRFEYGIYLLNKNLSQLRWLCSLPTSDLRPILRNVAELLALGETKSPLSESEVEALPKVKTLTSPPKSIEHQIVIRSGRAQIQGANRGPSPTKSFNAPSSEAGISVKSDLSPDDQDEDVLSSSESSSSPEGGSKRSSSTDSPPKATQRLVSSTSSTPTSPNGSTTLGKDQYNVFWGDVTSRTIALSNPSSFQRPRPNNHRTDYC